MKTLHFKIWIFLIFAVASGRTIAQVDVFQDEVENRNGIIYYGQQPLTGTIYSNDEEDIPNACQCTLKAHYSKGLADGERLEYYPNGTPKSKENFKNGKPAGESVKYDQSGQIIEKKTYQAGVPSETIYYKNGLISQKDIYRDGQLYNSKYYENRNVVKETFYYPDKTKEIQYYPDGKIKREAYYQNGIKNGEWTYYTESGEKDKQEIFYNGDLVGEGSYQNGKKDGVWYHYSNDKMIKTIETYRSGELVNTLTENFHYAIKNYHFRPYEIVLSERDKIGNNTAYYAWFPGIQPTDFPEVKKVKNKISEIVKRRSYSTPSDFTSVGDKILSYRFEIQDVEIQHKTASHQRSRVVNGKEQKFYITEFIVKANYKIYAYPMDSDKPEIFYFRASSQGGFGTSLLNTTLATYPRNFNEAFNRMLKYLSVYDFLVEYFPTYTQISEVKSQNSKKIKTIKTLDGFSERVFKGAHFTVYDIDKGTFNADIKIQKSESDFAIGKVKSGGEWLKKYLEKDKNPWLVEYLPE